MFSAFCVDCIAGWFPGGRPGPFWAQNWPKNLSHLFGLSWTRLNGIITIVSYPTVWHGIALLASARGLYLARHPLYTKTVFVSLSNENIKKCYFCLWTKGKQILLRIQVDRDHKVSLSPSWLNVKGNNMKSLANIKLSLLDHSDSRHHISETFISTSLLRGRTKIYNS